MTRPGDWLRCRLSALPWREPPPLPVRVPQPPGPDWGQVWVMAAARRLAAGLGPHEEPQDLCLTVRDGRQVYTGLAISPGQHSPDRYVLAPDAAGELRPVEVPDTVAGAEELE